MNRVKVWVFTLVVVALGFALVRAATVARRADAVAALDARLAGAAGHVAASARSLTREANAAVALVARDPGLGAALRSQVPATSAVSAPRGVKGKPPAPGAHPEDARLGEAARQALSAAEGQLGFELPGGTVVSAGNGESLARKGEPATGGDVAALLAGAIAGEPRRGFVRHDGRLWYGAAAPAGDGAGAVLLVPLDEGWARALAAVTGADVTVSAPEVKMVSTARAADLPLLQGAARRGGGAVDLGPPGKVDLSVGPLALPKLPQPVPGGAPLRARSIPIEGLKDAFAIVSIPTAASLDGAAAFFWRAIGVLALVLFAGLLLGLSVRSTEGPPQIPAELHAAAARIEKGDFAARVPPLAGRLGTVAAALNRAAELAGPAQAARGAPPPAARADDWFLGPARPALDERPPPPLAPPAEPPEAAGSPLAEAAEPGPTLPAPPAPAPPALGAALAPPGAAPELDEEAHWQQVFQDFVRTRATSGEPTEGLTFEKFRQKLEANRTQLVAKYGCKTVRFQVYVKEGKAALKATPVR